MHPGYGGEPQPADEQSESDQMSQFLQHPSSFYTVSPMSQQTPFRVQKVSLFSDRCRSLGGWDTKPI